MVEYRQSIGLSIDQMAKRIGVGRHLLEIIENGSVTHPDIAKQIGEGYGLNEEECLELIPPNHRQGDIRYNPDKYKRDVGTDKRRFKIVHRKHDEIDGYLLDCYSNSYNKRRRYNK